MQLAQLVNCLTLPKVDDCFISGVSIDSRRVRPGHCFIAIKGEQFDGHDFVSQAFDKGALAAIVDETFELDQTSHTDKPLLRVPCTLTALSQIAGAYREQFDIPIVALTGSCGKTTVKEMIAACLPKPSFATFGNLNNHIGVPLSLLSLLPEHRYAVFELGANHQGEIAKNIELVKPTVALINNIASAHLEGFGSIEGVADAKAEIYQGLVDHGIAIVNLDDHRVVAKARQVAFDKLKFSAAQKADVYASEIQFDGRGNVHCQLHFAERVYPLTLSIPGRHNLNNALAAAACCAALGLDEQVIVDGIASFGGVAGRMQLLDGHNGARIIDDTYNANLHSVNAALDVLSHYAGQRIFVMGELAEVGDDLDRHYEQIARYAESSNIDCLLTVGKRCALVGESFAGESEHFLDRGALVSYLLARLNGHTTVLVKGSRSAQMEQVVYPLQAG